VLHFEILEDISLLELDKESNVRKLVSKDESFQSLKESIRESGVLEPLVARRENDKYLVYIGQRRLLAIRELYNEGYRVKIPVIVKEVDETERKIESLIENILREDITPLERCEAIESLVEKLGSIDKVAKRLGVTRKTIYRWTRYGAIEEKLEETKIEEDKKQELRQVIQELPQRTAEKISRLEPERIPSKLEEIKKEKESTTIIERRYTIKISEKCYKRLLSASKKRNIPIDELAEEYILEGIARDGL